MAILQKPGFQKGRAAVCQQFQLEIQWQSAGCHVPSQTGLAPGRMGMESGPSHQHCRYWGGAPGRWAMVLQPPAAAHLSLSHRAMGQMAAEKYCCNGLHNKGHPGD